MVTTEEMEYIPNFESSDARQESGGLFTPEPVSSSCLILAPAVSHTVRDKLDFLCNYPSSPTETDSQCPSEVGNPSWVNQIATPASSPIPDDHDLDVPIPLISDAINEFNKIHGTKICTLDFHQRYKFYITDLALGSSDWFVSYLGIKEKIAEKLLRYLTVLDDQYRAAIRSAYRSRPSRA